MARPTRRGFRSLVKGSWFGGNIRGAGTSSSIVPVIVTLRRSSGSSSFLLGLYFAAYSKGIAASRKKICPRR